MQRSPTRGSSPKELPSNMSGDDSSQSNSRGGFNMDFSPSRGAKTSPGRYNKFPEDTENHLENCDADDEEFNLNRSSNSICDGGRSSAEDVILPQSIARSPSSTLLEQSGGRDSGISNDSSKFQDFFTKVKNIPL